MHKILHIYIGRCENKTKIKILFFVEKIKIICANYSVQQYSKNNKILIILFGTIRQLYNINAFVKTLYVVIFCAVYNL